MKKAQALKFGSINMKALQIIKQVLIPISNIMIQVKAVVHVFTLI